MLIFPKTFTENSFQTISHYRFLYLFSCYCESESWAYSHAITHQYRDTGIINPLVVIEYLPELCSSHQSQTPGKRLFVPGPHCLQISDQGVRRALPLALRALITPRPPRVCIRARNPCVLARFKLLGWNVRFMLEAPAFVARLNQ